MNIDPVPSLEDLQVLSPVAWVKQEKEAIEARVSPENIKTWNTRDYLGLLREDAIYARALAMGHIPAGDEKENRRKLEKTLIGLCAHTILWLEAIRREEIK